MSALKEYQEKGTVNVILKNSIMNCFYALRAEILDYLEIIAIDYFNNTIDRDTTYAQLSGLILEYLDNTYYLVLTVEGFDSYPNLCLMVADFINREKKTSDS